MTTKPNTAAAERARMAAIMGLPEAKAHIQLASHIATETGMTVQKAQQHLAAAAGGGRFAHLNTPEAEAGMQQWRNGRAATSTEAAAGFVLSAGGPGAQSDR